MKNQRHPFESGGFPEANDYPVGTRRVVIDGKMYKGAFYNVPEGMLLESVDHVTDFIKTSFPDWQTFDSGRLAHAIGDVATIFILEVQEANSAIGAVYRVERSWMPKELEQPATKSAHQLYVSPERKAVLDALGIDIETLSLAIHESQVCMRRLAPHQNGDTAIVPGPDDAPKAVGQIPEGTVTRTVSALGTCGNVLWLLVKEK